jgi:bifunctional non-homologous end joining protein LigD
MLATLVPAPFSRPNWHFEEKYDGVRMLAYKQGTKVSLVSRNLIDRTARYPHIASAIAALPRNTLLLDGEVVVMDPGNVSRFELLQQGRSLPRYVVFDCLYEDGLDLRKTPLIMRRQRLEQTIQASGPLLLSTVLGTDGIRAFQAAARRGLEGIVGKNLSSAYVERRSTEWLKVKTHREQEFVIGGYTPPAGSRQYFGALLLGVYSGSRLQYVGKVGAGFNQEILASLHRKFQRLIRRRSPFSAEVRERDATFLSPRLVAQVSFTEWTADGKLRHPVYLGLRDDKKPTDVFREGPGGGEKRAADGDFQSR